MERDQRRAPGPVLVSEAVGNREAGRGGDGGRPGGRYGHTLPPAVLVLAGFLFAIGLMIIDELLTLLRYCPGCKYYLPFLGPWDPYDVEILAWVLILVSFGLVFSYRRTH